LSTSKENQISDSDRLPRVGTETFSTLALFYEYDRDVWLDARTLERDENEAYIQEKVVFRGLCSSYELIGSPTKELVIFDGGRVQPAVHKPNVVEWFSQY
jgi:hypothetical protein